MKSFEQIFGEVYERKFGKPAQPAPAGPGYLALEITKAAATADPQPKPATPVQAADDGSEEREVICPECGHRFVPDWQSDSSTSEVAESDPDNGDDIDDAPAWENAASPGGLSFRTRKATASERRSLQRD
jgi:hypothetical protein